MTINGRFLSAPQTGVQRVAANLICALDDLLAESGACGAEWKLRAPRGAALAAPMKVIGFDAGSLLRGQAWEQLELPVSARRDGLVNLCNAGPLAASNALTLIHDAQVFLSPESYSPAFRRWYRVALPRLAANSRCVATVSEYSRRMLARFGVAPEDRIRVIPNGADHMLKEPPDQRVLDRLGLARRPFAFVFGSLQPHKNLALVLRAFADPKLRDVVLTVCGGVDSKAVESAFGIAPGRNIVFANRLPDGEIRALLEAAVCLLCPSSTEGFGLPPLEAMILGCPAIVAPAGALAEVCGDAAVYAPMDDPAAWAEAVLALAADESGRPDRSRRARAHATQFSWRRSADRLHALIETAR